MLVSQEHYEIPSSTPLRATHPPFCQPPSGRFLHAGRTHPGFLHGTAVRLYAQPRYQGVTTSPQETGKLPVPWRFIAVVSERDAIT
jgi:hypothetical protein